MLLSRYIITLSTSLTHGGASGGSTPRNLDGPLLVSYSQALAMIEKSLNRQPKKVTVPQTRTHKTEPLIHRTAPPPSKMSAQQISIDNADLEKLSDSDRIELRQFLANEQQRSQIQARTSSCQRKMRVKKKGGGRL